MNTGIVWIMIIANIVVSYKGLTNQAFYDGYKFEVDRVLLNKDYKRLVTSGFLHISWTQLVFSMLSLCFFSGAVAASLGAVKFLVIYFASLLGGNLFCLFVHRNHGEYTSVGASGAVCGVIFASIALFPGMGITLFPLPISVPNWIFGIFFVAYAIYGIKSGKDNVGHEAHLGGALVGMIAAILLVPSSLLENYPAILLITVPTAGFIYLIITRPHILLVDNFFYKTHQNHYSIDHIYNEKRTARQHEIDRILEKISRKGMNSLSQKEKDQLKDYAESMR